MSEKIPPLQPIDVKRQFSRAGFRQEEMDDIFDKVFSHSKTLSGDHPFFNFTQSIQYLMADNNGMGREEVIKRIASEPSPLFALYGINFPANTNPRKITLNANLRKYEEKTEQKEETTNNDQTSKKKTTETKEEKPPLVLDFDRIDKTLNAIVDASPNRIRPTAGEKGKIQHGPMKDELTLAALNMQLREYGIQNPGCGFNSLSTYLEMKNIGVQGSRNLSRRQETMGISRVSASDIFYEIEDAVARTGTCSLTSVFSAQRIEALNQAFEKGRVTGLAEIPAVRALPVTNPEDYIRNIQQFFNMVTNNQATSAETPKSKPATYPERRWG